MRVESGTYKLSSGVASAQQRSLLERAGNKREGTRAAGQPAEATKDNASCGFRR